MEQRQWEYKIRSNKTSILLAFIMLALSGGITLWLKSTGNGFFVIIGIFSAAMLLLFIATIYRFIFYKVLISSDGFYYQSSMSNGKYYLYKDIEKAWISSGTNQSGVQEDYCNIAPYNQPVIRFPFYFKDDEAVQYLIQKVEETSQMRFLTTPTEKDEYLIDGKVFGKTKIIIGIILLVLLVSINILIIKSVGFYVSLIPGFIMALAICWTLIVNYAFFQVKIEKTGFYCRTSPFNGKWYDYCNITHCKEIKRVVDNRSSNKRFYYFFEFTDINGKTRKFQFAKEIHEHEVNVLKERIEQYNK